MILYVLKYRMLVHIWFIFALSLFNILTQLSTGTRRFFVGLSLYLHPGFYVGEQQRLW